MSRRTIRFLARCSCALWFLTLLGCGASEAPSATKDPFAVGRELYAQNGCVLCHGENGRGDGPLVARMDPPPRDFHVLEDFRYGASLEEIMVTIQRGLIEKGGGMPPYDHLSEADRRELARYIVSLRGEQAAPEEATASDDGALSEAEASEIASSGKKLLRFDDLGGDFTLTDHHGRPFRFSDTTGRIRLLFFGYASCPDVCPQTLSKVGRVRKLLPEAARDALLTLFITVDPSRDTVERLHEYLDHFSIGETLGLTGDAAVIDQIVDSYSARYSYEERDSAAGYLVSHTSFLYLIDQAGVVRAILRHSTRPEVLAEAIGLLIEDEAVGGEAD